MSDTSSNASSNTDVSRVLQIEVPVVVKLAQRSLGVREVLDLSLGSIIEFDKAHAEPLELLINNACVGTGAAVKVGENFGLRITTIRPPRERVNALTE